MSEESQDASQRFCKLGEEHLEQDEPEEALQWYERAIDEDPQNHDAWSGRGRACYHLGQLERADRYFKRAQRVLGPRLHDRSRRRGWWADALGQTFLRILHWRALCRFWMGLYEDAARLFRRILKLAPSDPLEVRFLLGETYFRMGELDRSVQEFLRAGDDPDAYYNLGLVWFYKGEFVRSVNAFRRGMFENLHLASLLAERRLGVDLPSYRGTHPKRLDGQDAAHEYVERCGDLWAGRPLLRDWVRAILEHRIVQEDLRQHREQVAELALSAERLSPGDVARLEGGNTALRSAQRLGKTDLEVTQDVMRRVFRLPS